VNNAFTSDKTLKEGYVRDPCSCYFERSYWILGSWNLRMSYTDDI